MLNKLISGILLTVAVALTIPSVADAAYSDPLPNAACSDGRFVIYLNPQGVSDRVAVRVDNSVNGWGGDKVLPGDIVNNNVKNSAFVLGKKTAFEKLHLIPAKTSYLNLYKHYTYAKTLRQTPYTPAVQLFLAFDQALRDIVSLGSNNHFRKIKRHAMMIRKEFSHLGFETFIDTDNMSSALTTFLMPKGIQVKDLQSYLRRKGIIIYNGKGLLKDKAFQVATMGALTDDDIDMFLKDMRIFIQKQKTGQISYIQTRGFVALKSVK